MFNLIVSDRLEGDRRGSILKNRALQYTTGEIMRRFETGGALDLVAVKALPTVFMNEGVAGEVVRFGRLINVVAQGRYYELEYALDHEIPRMTNADISSLAADLHIEDFEFRTNHWAIKDVDLFQVLFRQNVGQRPVPTVFQLSENPINPRLVSLMMPFSADFDDVHQSLEGAIEQGGWVCKRADNFWRHDHIMKDIIELICTSQVVICDLSGKNPNVFYEAGIAHTLGKQVILVAQSMDDVPFDLRALRCITYLNNDEGRTKLAEDVVARLRTLM